MSNPERHPSIKRRPYAGSCHCGAIAYIVHLTLPLTSSTSTTDLTYKDIRAQTKHRIYRCNCNLCHKLGQFHVRLPYAPDDFLITKPRVKAEADLDEFMGTYRAEAGSDQRWMFCKKCGTQLWAIRGEFGITQVQMPWYLINHQGYTGRSYDDAQKEKAEKEAERQRLKAEADAKAKEEGLDGQQEKAGENEDAAAEADSETAPVKELIRQIVQKREAEDFELITIEALSPAEPKGAKWKEPPNYFSLNAVTLDLCQEGLDLRKWHENGWISYEDGLEWVGEGRTNEPYAGGMY